MTQPQLADVANDVDIVSHGATHVRQWELINTGISIYYLGADVSATGITNYTTTNGYAKTTSLQLTTSSNTDNIAVNISSTTTVADIKTTLEATGKWNVRIDPALPTDTRAINLLGMTASVTVGKTAATNGRFACGGGINVYYRQTNATTARNVVFQRPFNLSVLNLYVDGVQIASWDLSNGSYNTLSKIVTAINGAGISGLTAQLANQGGTQDYYCQNYIAGTEASVALRFAEHIDITACSQVLDAGLSRITMIANQLAMSDAWFRANGFTATGYAQSGGQMYPHMVINSPFTNHRVENIFNSYHPFPQVINQGFEHMTGVRNHRNFRNAKFDVKYVGAGASATLQMTADRVVRGIVEANVGHADSFTFDTTNASYDTIGELKTAIEAVNGGGKWQVTVQALSTAASPNHDPCTLLDVSIKAYDAMYDNTLQIGAPLTLNAITIEREKRAIDAFCTSKGFMTDVLIHHVLPDGSAGSEFNLDAGSVGFLYADATETQLTEVIRYLAGKRDAGEIDVLSPSDAAKRMSRKSRPTNLIFNPGFVCSSDNLMVDDTVAGQQPGKRIPGWALQATAANLTALGVTNGALTITTSSNASFTPIFHRFVLEPGMYEFGFELDMDIVAGGAVVGQINSANGRPENASPSDSLPYWGYCLAYQNGHQRVRFAVDDDHQPKLPTLIGRNSQTFNLSANKNIRLNLDNRGLTADIDCSAGAASAAAVTAKEVAAAINAAIAGNATYPAEFHSCASAVNGKVVIASPYKRTGIVGGIVVAAGTTADASAAIFGGTGVGLAHGYSARQPVPQQYPAVLSFLVNAQGTIKIKNPYIQRLRVNS